MEPITQTLEEVKAELSKPKEAPKQLSRKELGALRKQYYTRQLGSVTECGHAFDPNHFPNHNCDACYYAFFKTSANLDEIRQVMGAGGVQGLTAKYGRKFARAFRDFLHFELTVPVPAEPEEKLGAPALQEL